MPELRQGRRYFRASWPIIRFMRPSSEVPAMGAPDFIETAARKLPKIIGVPGRSIWP